MVCLTMVFNTRNEPPQNVSEASLDSPERAHLAHKLANQFYTFNRLKRLPEPLPKISGQTGLRLSLGVEVGCRLLRRQEIILQSSL
jgi:hypothetical protein